MNTHRLNIDFPADDYIFLKMICAEKEVTIKDFLVPVIQRAIEEEEDALLIRKAKKRLKNIHEDNLIPINQAFKAAGWNV